jgi:hypothetical protein
MKRPIHSCSFICCALLALAVTIPTGCEKSTPSDTTAPDPPVILPPPADSSWDETGTDAVPEEDWIQVTWLSNQEDDLRGYRVYRSSPPLNLDTLLVTLTVGGAEEDTLFDDTTVALGIRYTYTVTAFDRSGNESGASEEVDYLLISKLDAENLMSPRGTISDRRPTFTWTSTGESIENILRVYDSDQGRTVWVSEGQNPFSSPHQLPYDDDGTAADSLLTPGHEYWWRVDRTGSEYRSGSESNWVSFTIED